MTSFIQVIQNEMQSSAFIDILNHHFPQRTDDEHRQIIDEINDMMSHDSDIQDISSSTSTTSTISPRIALDYLQTLLTTIHHTRTPNMTTDDHNQNLPDFFTDSPIDDDLDFSLSSLDDNPDSDLNTNTDSKSTNINDVWSMVVQKALQDQTTKSSPAA